MGIVTLLRTQQKACLDSVVTTWYLNGINRQYNRGACHDKKSYAANPMHGRRVSRMGRVCEERRYDVVGLGPT